MPTSLGSRCRHRGHIPVIATSSAIVDDPDRARTTFGPA